MDEASEGNVSCKRPLQKKESHVCFIFDTQKTEDSRSDNSKGLRFCSGMASETFNQMKECMQSYLADKNSAFHHAANWLLLKISGNSKEIPEICNHNLCCVLCIPGTKLTEDDLKKWELERAATKIFLKLFEHKVIVDEEAYLLRDLMDDIKENGLHELSIC